jgi:starvation-inducible DNA-binding protein
MKTLTKIGLEADNSVKTSELLNDLLANYSMLYQNVRGYHWNVKGRKFFELHLKFEELYNNLFLKIDEIAERILTLGHIPNHKFSNYLNISAIHEAHEVADGIFAMENILFSFTELLKKQRTILELANDGNDEGTSSMMSDYIREQEKMVWMYSAYLDK